MNDYSFDWDESTIDFGSSSASCYSTVSSYGYGGSSFLGVGGGGSSMVTNSGLFMTHNSTVDSQASSPASSSSLSPNSVYSINQDSGLDSTICYYQDQSQADSTAASPSVTMTSPPVIEGNPFRYFSTSAGISSNGSNSQNQPPLNGLIQPKMEVTDTSTLLEFPMAPPTTTNVPIAALTTVSDSIISSKSFSGRVELKILSQPSHHHRARYRTEGSRGAVKDRTGRSFPIVKLVGYNKGPVKLRCYIGHDKRLGEPHLFYQVSKIVGKSVTPCSVTKIEGIKVVELDLLPSNNMEAVINCIGIVKERNFDVQKKTTNLKKKQLFSSFLSPSGRSSSFSVKSPPSFGDCSSSGHASSSLSSSSCGGVGRVTSTTSGNNSPSCLSPVGGGGGSKGVERKSTSCTLVFGCQISETRETLQVVSDVINCAQLLGNPEIQKISSVKSDLCGGTEIFIIGKNFTRDTKIIWDLPSILWYQETNPEQEFLNQNHLIFRVPKFPIHLFLNQANSNTFNCNNNQIITKEQIPSAINVNMRIKCNDKHSDPVIFTYNTPVATVNGGTMGQQQQDAQQQHHNISSSSPPPCITSSSQMQPNSIQNQIGTHHLCLNQASPVTQASLSTPGASCSPNQTSSTGDLHLNFINSHQTAHLYSQN